MNKKFKSLAEIEKHFDSDWNCRKYIESLRWKDGVTSPYTGSRNVKRVGYYDSYTCLDTGKGFSPLTGTIFSKSKVELLLWFKVIWLNWSNPRLNSVEISKLLGLNQKTVWSMLKKIKTASGINGLCI